MRLKKEAVLCFASNDEGLPKVVRDYRARYRLISQVLDRNAEILDLVDRDLQKGAAGQLATGLTACFLGMDFIVPIALEVIASHV
jgi:hypothetical protein